MAVGTKELDILRPVVEPVAVLVIYVQSDPLPEPLLLDTTSFAFAAVFAAHLDEGPPENVWLLSEALRPKDENLLPGYPVWTASVSLSAVGPSPAEVRRVDPERLDPPGDVGVRSPGRPEVQL